MPRPHTEMMHSFAVPGLESSATVVPVQIALSHERTRQHTTGHPRGRPK